jgi:hypothetical protein
MYALPLYKHSSTDAVDAEEDRLSSIPPIWLIGINEMEESLSESSVTKETFRR